MKWHRQQSLQPDIGYVEGLAVQAAAGFVNDGLHQPEFLETFAGAKALADSQALAEGSGFPGAYGDSEGAMVPDELARIRGATVMTLLNFMDAMLSCPEDVTPDSVLEMVRHVVGVTTADAYALGLHTMDPSFANSLGVHYEGVGTFVNVEQSRLLDMDLYTAQAEILQENGGQDGNQI